MAQLLELIEEALKEAKDEGVRIRLTHLEKKYMRDNQLVDRELTGEEKAGGFTRMSEKERLEMEEHVEKQVLTGLLMEALKEDGKEGHLYDLYNDISTLTGKDPLSGVSASALANKVANHKGSKTK